MNKKSIHLKDKNIIVKGDRDLFGKMCVCAEARIGHEGNLEVWAWSLSLAIINP